MEPLPEGKADALTGMNVSYDRDAIAAMEDLLREGRWEAWLHARLRERGIGLHCAADMVLEHDKDFGARRVPLAALALLALVRRHAKRGARPPPLASTRSARRCCRPCSTGASRGTSSPAAAGGASSLLATPLILLYVGVWAAGEAVGYAFGGGRSLLKVR